MIKSCDRPYIPTCQKARSPLHPNLSQSAIAPLPLYLQKNYIQDKLGNRN
ncbi:hypothetical protein QUB05_10105 [Microcoleus sp. F10-C6]